MPQGQAKDGAAFTLGVVMLNTRFPRVRGDIGNPESFGFPVLYRRVEPATVSTVVVGEALDPGVAEAILAAALALEAEGADLIATSCGFLGGLQGRLQAALTVPVIASALVLLPLLSALYGPGRPIGVLTFDARRLAPRHFGSGRDPEVAIEGLESGGELFRVISGDLPELDPGRAEADALAAAGRLVARHPEVPAILLECTNLSPYRAAIARATGRPVHDLNQAIAWLAAGRDRWEQQGE